MSPKKAYYNLFLKTFHIFNQIKKTNLLKITPYSYYFGIVLLNEPN